MAETTSDSVETRLRLVESAVTRIDRQMNGNGKPGLLDKFDDLAQEIRENRRVDTEHVNLLHNQNAKRMDRMEGTQKRVAWIALGVYIAWQFLTGNGTATLKGLLDVTHH